MGRTKEGPLIRKYCSGSIPSGPVKVKSTEVWIGWNSTVSTFSGSWTTYTGNKEDGLREINI